MKKIYKLLICFAILLILLTCAFFFYVSDYYHADSVVHAISQSADYSEENSYTVIYPENPNSAGFIFYPGGKVEESSYLPLLEKLSKNGLTCVLVKMPFRLAVLDINAADDIYLLFPEVKTWYIGGHSLGGAMASSYASSNQVKIKGLILLGSYIYGDFAPQNALTIYGSNDLILDKSKISYTENIVEISGGNHSYFGNYGDQRGDGVASISQDEQQNITVEAILAFINKDK